MNRRLIWLVTAAVLFLFPLAYAEIDTLTILHLNDTHAHLMSYGPKNTAGDWTWGGYARIATLVGMNRMTEPNVMLMHGGDFCVGDFMFQEYLGIAELEIMKALNFDALELGNHEFDLYPSTLKYMLDQAGFPSEGFPLLCANLDLSGDIDSPPLSYFVNPYTIKDVGGVRVGIFGLMTDMTNQVSNPGPIVVLPPLGVAQAWVDSLRIGHGCDVVILLSHMGADYDQMAAATISGIDVIVGGHSHTIIQTPIQIGNTLVLQAGEFGRYLGKLHLIVEDGVFDDWDYSLISVDESVPAEPTLAGMIGYLAAGVEADPRFGPVYSNVIASANTELTKPIGAGLVKDTPLGNLVADALRNQTGTDIAFQPQGFISQTIYSGDIKASDVFQALPYGFDQTSGLGLKLVTFQTDGMSIIAALEFSVYNLPYVEDFFQQGSNISYAYDLAAAPGGRIDYSTMAINGQPLNPMGTYTVTAPDAVVPFLSQIPGFNISNLVLTDYFVYSVARDYMASHSPVSYYSEARVIDISLLDDPMVGVGALSDVVDLFAANGSIEHPRIVWMLDRQLNYANGYLRANRIDCALTALRVFSLEVSLATRFGLISEFASYKLIYLAGKLQESIDQFYPKPLAGESLPSDFELAQNYPNPFNPQTEISYSLPVDSDVRLTVFNILGETVRELINSHESAGNHSVIWDGLNEDGIAVASGTYFYMLRAGQFSETRKMCLMR